jgi:putative spermidine/putrescine transport system permease protein
VLWRALIAVLYVFLLGPVAVVVLVSFEANSYLVFPPQELDLRWYAALLANKVFVNGFRVSLTLGVLTAAMASALGVPAALAITRYRFRGRDALTTFFILPLMVPSIVLGLALLLFLTPLRLTATYPGLLAAHLVVTLPYVIRTVSTSLMTLAPEYEGAAMTLGATPWQVFRRVTLPLIQPGVIAGAALAFLVSFDEVVISLFLVGPRVTTLPVHVFRYVQDRADPQAAALSVVLIALSVGVMLLIERALGLRRILEYRSR